MNRDDAVQWKKIIDEDLMHARQCLRSTSSRADGFLRDRISEDEAILERLETLERGSDVFESLHAA